MREVPSLDWNLLDDLNAVSVQPDYFARVIGQQPNGVQPEVAQDLSADPTLMLQAPLPVGRSRVGVVAKPRPGLMEVHEHARSLFGNPLERTANHAMAIAGYRAEDIAVNAVGMHTHEHVFAAGEFAVDECQMPLGRRLAIGNDGGRIHDGLEIAEFSAQAAFRLALNQMLGLQTVANQIRHRDHKETMTRAEFLELRDARHGPVVVHDFADHTARPQSREASHVDDGLRLSRAHQDATVARAQGKYVPGPRQILRAAGRIDGNLNGSRAIRRRYPSRHAFSRLDRFAESRAESRRIALRHLRQVQRVANLFAQREADEPAGVLGHEIDDVGRYFFSRNGEVAFILPVF